MKNIIFILFIILSPFVGLSQNTDQQLAQHYYNNGEFSKALVYYERLYDADQSKFNFGRYLECLVETGDDKEAEKILKKTVNRNKYDQEYSVMLAKFYEERGRVDEASAIYDDLIENMHSNAKSIVSLYNLFKAQNKGDMAYATIVKGRKLLKKTYPLNYQFAEYYGSIGETENMINEYLDLLDYHSSYITTIKRVLAAQIDFSVEESEEYELLKMALLERTQKNPNDVGYADMLTWLFIQRQNFSAALVHIKAMDKRSDANGRLVYDFGNICIENKDFPSARKAFKHVVEIGEKSTYFMSAQNALLNVSFLEVTTRRDFSQTELNQTIGEYNKVLEEYGKSKASLSIIMELAHIKAFYANKSVEAMDLLNEALEFQGLSKFQAAQVKMQLADIYVLHGDIWEASLLYMQVDTDFKYEPIGQEAKFKNARIFYYDGEFEFAQSQLDVLKQSTSKLIANDALKLSLFITDNYGMDSNYIAMSNFANADLLIEQHRYEEAFNLFDSIIEQFPAHSLGDEILLKKAHAMQLKGQWNDAIVILEELLKYHSADILADDALFQLAEIYQNHLMNDEKAAEYYKRILFDYRGSLYTTEARKRYQLLRKTDGLEEKIDG